jgi:NAD(P)H-flavin reductase/quinol-cytochrome oxidoreductase complex cytochrome b subunit/ferredoxin
LLQRIQSLGQAAFLLVEAGFNRAFGDRLNPFYQLGAIAFFLFWIVAASGLYLYAFFKTGVADAYASVQSLTHGQWWAGGILRSVHRYASDAMVLTMLLHLLRHFAFDRFRGWRWFSWVTGVALIWLVYISGINGYMLPWDKLAQFVITASFEWLDWLPSFGGTLMRNFIYPTSVNDRLFSLLAFMHIGVPLALLLLMWVHVQRVPKASTTPSRAIRIGLGLTLLAMALVVPVTSQGGASNLAVAPGRLAFDWFFLAIYPLLYAWPLGQVWALVVAATLLLTLLPWLPPRLRLRAARREFFLNVHAGESASAGPAHDAQVMLREGETLLDAGLRQGLALPYECRNGGCGVCICTVLHGRVDLGAYQPSALPEAARAAGQALMCCATAREDVAIEVEEFGAPAAAAPQRYVGRVERMERLAEDVMRVVVALPQGRTIAFAAGQYVNIVLDDGQYRAFSFANPPQDDTHLELHVRRIPGGRFTGHVFERMQVGDELGFEGPLGGFILRESTRPIVFVAGATGFAPVKSIVEDALRRGVRRPMWLYWGVRRRADLYLAALAESWQRDHANVHFVPVLSEPTPEDDWHGRTGLVHEAILADFPRLDGQEVYVCGSIRMVEAAVPAFIASGLAENACFSDAFTPTAAAAAPG